MDSDDDFFYSSPDDETEFLSREFLKDYDSARSDRLVAMGKGELINEYLQMEARIDSLEKRLQRSAKRKDGAVAAAAVMPPADPDTTERIGVFQREIQALEAENAALREETRMLRQERQGEAEAEAAVPEEGAEANWSRNDGTEEAVVSSSSSDDEASSSDSSSSSEGESDNEEEDLVNLEADIQPLLDQKENHGDTGYESQREDDEPEAGGRDGGTPVTSSTTSL